MINTTVTKYDRDVGAARRGDCSDYLYIVPLWRIPNPQYTVYLSTRSIDKNGGSVKTPPFIGHGASLVGREAGALHALPVVILVPGEPSCSISF